ncbi:YgjV family protein [Vibrio sp. SCSIO 43136]|uniref:YgjV family protein n=1 Tax=Vibrio sp. SCSIO 43136 TaxID=2819101 RepID=UPI002074C2A4|nr:YgjV family protein [Vibrio sp. SCSIO 43136]USD67836.1 YgjV family protein [Vibrio sp. SCSIO 43136]
MWEFNLAQAVGLVAFLIGVSAFFQKDGHKFRLHLMVFQCVLVVHFAMMEAWVAAAGCGISAIRSYVSTKTQSVKVMAFFVAALWLFGLPQMNHGYELLTIIGASVATYGLFCTQGITMRILILFNSCCWLTNNIFIGSIGGTMMEATFIVSNLITIYRLKTVNLKQVNG